MKTDKKTITSEEEKCLKTGKKRVWKFVNKTDWEHFSERLKGRDCNFEWLSITDGLIRIKGSNKNGYAWDGCSPKGNLLHITIGNFDGQMKRFEKGNYKPYTYYASMTHDILYQYKKCAPITRKEADIIFYELLKDSGFMWARIFYVGVRLFGRIMGSWKYKSNKSI